MVGKNPDFFEKILFLGWGAGTKQLVWGPPLREKGGRHLPFSRGHTVNGFFGTILAPGARQRNFWTGKFVPLRSREKAFGDLRVFPGNTPGAGARVLFSPPFGRLFGFALLRLENIFSPRGGFPLGCFGASGNTGAQGGAPGQIAGETGGINAPRGHFRGAKGSRGFPTFWVKFPGAPGGRRNFCGPPGGFWAPGKKFGGSRGPPLGVFASTAGAGGFAPPFCVGGDALPKKRGVPGGTPLRGYEREKFFFGHGGVKIPPMLWETAFKFFPGGTRAPLCVMVSKQSAVVKTGDFPRFAGIYPARGGY